MSWLSKPLEPVTYNNSYGFYTISLRTEDSIQINIEIDFEQIRSARTANQFLRTNK